jgi:hypothetical protein
MPLSEQEQRLLDEMERNLYQNDGDFIASVDRQGSRTNPTFIVIGALVAIAGVALLLVGIGTQVPILGVVLGIVGFVVMFAGALFAISPPRRVTMAAQQREARREAAGFMDSFGEQRQ